MKTNNSEKNNLLPILNSPEVTIKKSPLKLFDLFNKFNFLTKMPENITNAGDVSNTTKKSSLIDFFVSNLFTKNSENELKAIKKNQFEEKFFPQSLSLQSTKSPSPIEKAQAPTGKTISTNADDSFIQFLNFKKNIISKINESDKTTEVGIESIPNKHLRMPNHSLDTAPNTSTDSTTTNTNSSGIPNHKNWNEFIHHTQAIKKIEALVKIILTNSKDINSPTLTALKNIKTELIQLLESNTTTTETTPYELLSSFVSIAQIAVDSDNHTSQFINNSITKKIFNEINPILNEIKIFTTEIKNDIIEHTKNHQKEKLSEFSIMSFINANETPMKSFQADISQYQNISQSSINEIKNLFSKLNITHVEIINNKAISPEIDFDFKHKNLTSRTALSSVALIKQTEKTFSIPMSEDQISTKKLFQKPTEYSSKTFSDDVKILKKALLTDDEKKQDISKFENLTNSPEIITFKSKSIHQTRNIEFIFDRITDEISKKASLPLSKLRINFNPDINTHATLIISGNIHKKNIDIQIQSNNAEFLDMINNNKNNLVSKIDSTTQFTANNISTLQTSFVDTPNQSTLNHEQKENGDGGSKQHNGREQQQNQNQHKKRMDDDEEQTTIKPS